MKISLYVVLGMAALLLAAGCAHQPAQGGASARAFEGYSQGQGSSVNDSALQDYRDILSDPGPF